ncbi:MAG: hypothetical protein ACR2QJ_14545 [Geminicoccaceae bacterium]
MTTGIVREISHASQERATGVQEINAAVTDMDEMAQQNAAPVEEDSAAARSLSDQAGNFAKATAFFKLVEGTRPPRRPATARAFSVQLKSAPAHTL